MAKGIPKHDGSGRGIGANKGRGGCNPLRGGNKGRIFEGPRGGQWTKGRKRNGPPNQQIENCSWLRKKKKKKK